MANPLHKTGMLERGIYHEICRREGGKGPGAGKPHSGGQAPDQPVSLRCPVCAGDMLFNLFDEYMGFLRK